jgi:hypothetical protein
MNAGPRRAEKGDFRMIWILLIVVCVLARVVAAPFTRLERLQANANLARLDVTALNAALRHAAPEPPAPPPFDPGG